MLDLITTAHAYIDPGTTGLVLGGGLLAPILAFLTSVLAAMGLKKSGKYLKYILSAIVLSLIIIASIMYLKNNHQQAPSRKVLVLGIDALDPKVVSSLIEQGALPNFAKLSQEGSFSELPTSIPPETPVAWTTIATGVNPGSHGIYDFVVRDPGTYLPKLSVNDQAQGLGGSEYLSPVATSQWWQHTSQTGTPTSVYRWPVTFPPDQIKGQMLSGLGVPDIRGFLSGYSYYTDEKVVSLPGKPERKVQVEIDNQVIQNKFYGPNTIKNGKTETITTNFTLALAHDSATLKVGNDTYPLRVGEWSSWIRVPFQISFLKEVTGIAKAYLISTSPFQMYLTSVQLDPRNPLSAITSPSDYSHELAESNGDYYTLGMPEETAGLNDGILPEEAFLAQIQEIEAERDQMFWQGFDAFNNQSSGIYSFVYDSLDRLQHMFWEKDRLNDHLKDYYLTKDALLGQIMGKIDENTALIIVSDHGFTHFDRAVNLNTWLAQEGYLHLTKAPADNDPGSLYQYVDWSRSQAYAMGFASIYLNLEGREPEGIVTNQDRLLDELSAKLLTLSDQGQPVIHAVYKARDIYSGSELLNAPDLMVGFNKGYRMDWEAPIGGTTKEVIYDNVRHWRGDHLVDPSFVPGVLMTNFKLSKTTPQQIDLAPTIIDLLGQDPQAQNYQGKSLLP